MFVSASGRCQAAGPCQRTFIQAGLAVSTATLLLRAAGAAWGGSPATIPAAGRAALRRYPALISQQAAAFAAGPARCRSA
jgi:hypothetical protein